MGERKVERRTGRHMLETGFLLNGKYKIGEIIGEGGFAVTYLGVRIEDNLRVAVKEYMPDRFIGSTEESGAQAEKVVMREYDILKKYSYLEGIVTVLDTFAAGNTMYIVMEYVEGITLAQYIRENGVFSYDELISLLEPIIKSLAQIHRQGVIHRDISPENIQIGLDNRFYLLDFGAAKQVSMLGNQNTVVFKNGYAPPEQYTGSGKQGSWTDVYALASTMYTALTGEILTDSVTRLQDDDCRWMDRLDALDDWQRQVLKQALSLKAADRYKNMEDFWLALSVRPVLEDRVTQVVAATSKRKIVVWTLCVAVVILAMAVSGILIFTSRNDNKTYNSSSAAGRVNSTEMIKKDTTGSTATTEKKNTSENSTAGSTAATEKKVSTTEKVTTRASEEVTEAENYTDGSEYTDAMTDYNAADYTESQPIATEAATTEKATEAVTEKTTTEKATTEADKPGFSEHDLPEREYEEHDI